VLPILALLLFAVVQLGATFHNYLTLEDAVRAGARKGAVARTAANPSSTAATGVRTAAGSLDQSQLQVSVTSTWRQGEDVTVSATYPYEISLFGVVVKSGRLSSSSTELVE